MNQLEKKHTLEMLSNGTIDGFIVSVSEKKLKSRLRSFLSNYVMELQ
jgi:hypothetical protein